MRTILTPTCHHSRGAFLRIKVFLYVLWNCFGIVLTQSSKEPYYTTSTDEVGAVNTAVTLGNPFKGITSNPDIGDPFRNGIPFSLEAYYVPFDLIVRGRRSYNWTDFDNLLDACVLRGAHSIPRVYIHYPGQPLRLPKYLTEGAGSNNIVRDCKVAGERQKCPYYSHPPLLQAINDFILEFGRKYNGDRRIFSIQAGLIGYWGEWHTTEYEDHLPESVTVSVLSWYRTAFPLTPIQIRYPMEVHTSFILPNHFGYHDDSFTHSTLDGKYNGGVEKSNYFWSRMERTNETEFWRNGPMGGEMRSENGREVFKEGVYPINTEYNQDVWACIDITHTTYLKNANAFRSLDLSDVERRNINRASIRMGYTFYVSEVSVIEATKTLVDIAVTIQQLGIAPFYYPLSITLDCDRLNTPLSIPGVEGIIDKGTSQTFVFRGIWKTPDCLNSVKLSLYSNMVQSKPVKLAQNDGTVFLSLPMPFSFENSGGGPGIAPVAAPTEPINIKMTHKLLNASNLSQTIEVLNSNANNYIDLTKVGEYTIEVEF